MENLIVALIVIIAAAWLAGRVKNALTAQEPDCGSCGCGSCPGRGGNGCDTERPYGNTDCDMAL